MSIRTTIADILTKRHERVTALEGIRRDLSGLESAIEKLLQLAGGGADSQ